MFLLLLGGGILGSEAQMTSKGKTVCRVGTGSCLGQPALYASQMLRTQWF